MISLIKLRYKAECRVCTDLLLPGEEHYYDSDGMDNERVTCRSCGDARGLDEETKHGEADRRARS